LLAPRW